MVLGQASSRPLSLIADFALGGSQETVGCMAKKKRVTLLEGALGQGQRVAPLKGNSSCQL